MQSNQVLISYSNLAFFKVHKIPYHIKYLLKLTTRKGDEVHVALWEYPEDDELLGIHISIFKG